MLKKITLLSERVDDWNIYPFNVPTISTFSELMIRSRVLFFTGENGSGKSTLLEAIAADYGFGPEGGNRNFSHNSTTSNNAIDPLAEVLRLSFDVRTGAGYYLRAESFFNTATYIDQLGVGGYGDRRLHDQSHGESFFTLIGHKFRSNGLFLIDEPEAALSPQRLLSLLVLLHDTLQQHKDAQFIISTHSPILLAFPGAQILSFDHGLIHEIDYEDASPVRIVQRFLNDREHFLNELLQETPSLVQE
jgi:predicted ATPase